MLTFAGARPTCGGPAVPQGVSLCRLDPGLFVDFVCPCRCQVSDRPQRDSGPRL